MPLVTPNSPGAAVLIRQGGQTLFTRGYGLRDLREDRTRAAIDVHTNFRLASCTKQFTAMAIMLLVHDGKLRYDDKLTDVVPYFPAYGDEIRLRHLLNHTSGLPDYETLMEAQKPDRWSEENQIQDAEVLALLKQTSEPLFPAGTKWSYSNSGYVVLGLIVAKVSGESFGDFLRERIFTPLQMTNTLAFEKGKNEVANRAYGHVKEGSNFVEADQSSTSATLGDGGVYSSVEDLKKWDEALTKHTLLTEEEMQPALTSVRLADGAPPLWPANSDRPESTPVAYGFGWFLDPYQGHARMWHYGDTRGFHTFIQRFDNYNLTIAVLCNRTDLDPEQLSLKVADLIFTSRK